MRFAIGGRTTCSAAGVRASWRAEVRLSEALRSLRPALRCDPADGEPSEFWRCFQVELLFVMRPMHVHGLQTEVKTTGNFPRARRLELGEFAWRTLWSAAIHDFAPRNRSALAMTDTELKLMAAPAMMGLSRTLNKGYSTPAATGMPS